MKSTSSNLRPICVLTDFAYARVILETFLFRSSLCSIRPLETRKAMYGRTTSKRIIVYAMYVLFGINCNLDTLPQDLFFPLIFADSKHHDSFMH